LALAVALAVTTVARLPWYLYRYSQLLLAFDLQLIRVHSVLSSSHCGATIYEII